MDGPTYLSLGSLAPEPAAAPATAPPVEPPWPYNQLVLALHMKALVDAYGWRTENAGDKRRVPYIPVPFGERLLRYYWKLTREALQRGVPDEQERKWLTGLRDASTAAIGDINLGLLQWNEDHFEKAPPAVAGKAPALYAATADDGQADPAGQPHPLVLKVNWAAHLLRNLSELAFGLDKLDGVTERLDLLDSLENVIKQALADYKKAGRLGVKLGDKLLGPFEAVGRKGVALGDFVAELPGKIGGALQKGVTTIALAALVLGVVYAVTK